MTQLTEFEQAVLDFRQELAEIKYELIRLREAAGEPDPAADWELTTQAAKNLGIRTYQLRKLRLDGYLKLGTHYRVISGDEKPRCQYHIQRCQELLNTHPSRRKKYG